MCRKLTVLMFFVFVFGLASVCWATVLLPSPFTDHAVLQQGMLVPVWGTANSGEQVTVDFDVQSKSTTADGNGDWMVYLDPMSASTSGADLVITGDNTITITDVWVGEVWFASGQSNMKFILGSSDNWNEAQNDAVNHNIRWHFNNTQWKELAAGGTPLRNVSAVAYYFTHELAHNMGNIAIGIVQGTSPGTDITEFTNVRGLPEDGTFYNDKIVPVQPYAIKGAIWYQGENESAQMYKAIDYGWKLTGLIDEWRTDWGQGDFPFGIVQLHSENDGTNRDSWSTVMYDQFWVSQTIPNCGLAVNWDTPHTGAPAHPGLKTPVGERLALWARADVYGHTGFEYSSPIPDPALSSVNGNEMTVGFGHVGGGLITDDALDPSGFQLSGPDRIFYDATGQIVGNSVVLSSPSVSNPTSVRFVWPGDISEGNLFNAEMLATPLFEMNLAAEFAVNPNFELDGSGNVDLNARPISDCWLWQGWEGSESVVSSDHPSAWMEAQYNAGSIWQDGYFVAKANTVYTLSADIKSVSGAGATCLLDFETVGDYENDEETLCVLPASGWQNFTAVLDTAASPAYVGRRVAYGIRPNAGLAAWTNIRVFVGAGGSYCGDATCDPGEDQCNCSSDCGAPPATETNCTDGIDEDCDGNTDCADVDCDGNPACPGCGDATCDPGEDQCNCPGDCGTPPATETNCTDGINEDCDANTDCNDSDCASDPACQSACNNNGTCETGEDCNNCSNDCISKTNGNPNSQYCCGDGTCEGAEDSSNCSVDCGSGPVCGDGTCDPGEDNSNCPADCPPSACNNNGICESGEDCNNCGNDCDGVTGGNPANRYCCGNGVAEGPEGDGTICDGNY